VLSFVNVGIFWNNHHHMLHVTKHVDGRVLWANLALLFFMSLVPFVIRWIGEGGIGPAPAAAYGLVLSGAAISYTWLQTAIIRCNPDSILPKVIGSDWKGKISIVGYVAGVPLAFLRPWISITIYVAIAAMWFVPDGRIEHTVSHQWAAHSPPLCSVPTNSTSSASQACTSFLPRPCAAWPRP
jgi:TMEM175 potassium channel family protein